jgi:cytochrome c oxidase assembly protein subunit 11
VDRHARANTRLAVALAAVCGVMVGASFAAVPFYSWFCRVTGYGGTTNVAAAVAPAVLDRTVTVRFDANVAPGMPWEFHPKQQQLTLKLGETGLAFYEAYNPTDEVVAGQAGFNVVPFEVGRYFDKIACFCFEMQVLQPHERIEMPVTFYVDPAMLADIEARGTSEITLSYTMFRTEVPETASLAAASESRLAAVPAAGGTIEQ